MAAALIFSLRVLSRTRHKLADAHAERAQQELTIRGLRYKINVLKFNPRWYKEKSDDKIVVYGEHYDIINETFVVAAIRVYYFDNAEEESFADLLADELLDKLEEDNED